MKRTHTHTHKALTDHWSVLHQIRLGALIFISIWTLRHLRENCKRYVHTSTVPDPGLLGRTELKEKAHKSSPVSERGRSMHNLPCSKEKRTVSHRYTPFILSVEKWRQWRKCKYCTKKKNPKKLQSITVLTFYPSTSRIIIICNWLVYQKYSTHNAQRPRFLLLM